MHARRFARSAAALATASMLGACATGQLTDLFDGGDCTADPTLCAPDSSTKHDGGKDTGAHDSTAADAPSTDGSGQDAGADATTDSSADASIDTAPDTSPDTGVDAAPEGGGLDGGVLVFDSIPGSTITTTRGAGDSCGTAISVQTTQTIRGISVKNTLSVPTNIKFMIWNKATSTLLYISPAKQFTTAGDNWKDSDAISFQLVAGTQYYIGGISDTAGTWDDDTTAETMNGITSLVQNPNWTNFANPTLGGNGAADCGIRLYR